MLNAYLGPELVFGPICVYKCTSHTSRSYRLISPLSLRGRLFMGYISWWLCSCCCCYTLYSTCVAVILPPVRGLARAFIILRAAQTYNTCSTIREERKLLNLNYARCNFKLLSYGQV